jgi:hypothetical protein
MEDTFENFFNEVSGTFKEREQREIQVEETINKLKQNVENLDSLLSLYSNSSGKYRTFLKMKEEHEEIIKVCFSYKAEYRNFKKELEKINKNYLFKLSGLGAEY